MPVCLFALLACLTALLCPALPCLTRTKAFTIGVFVGIRGVPRVVVGDAGRDRCRQTASMNESQRAHERHICAASRVITRDTAITEHMREMSSELYCRRRITVQRAADKSGFPFVGVVP